MPLKYLAATIIAVPLLISPPRSLGQTPPQSQCLSYEPAVVTVSGTLVRRTFPGPPNYESVKKGDKPETSWFLDLPADLCVDEDRARPDLNPRQSAIREIQLVLTPEQYQRRKGMVGSKVVATGMLFGEHTAHHHTSVLLMVQTLEKRK